MLKVRANWRAQEISGIPVLLGLLVLIFATRTKDEPLPSSRHELYQMAVEAALRRRLDEEGKRTLARAMLTRIAVAVHGAGLREFGERSHVELALAAQGSELTLWRELVGQDKGVPLVKTLEVAGVSSSSADTHFQFKRAPPTLQMS